MMRTARPRSVLGLLAVVLVILALVLVKWMDSSNTQTIHFQPIAGPILNPLMGWAPRADRNDIQQPHTLVYADLTWRDFEPEQGVFDFETFERKQQLDRWRAENQRVVFRFVCDAPGPSAHRDIPDWLYEAIGGSGDSYDTSYGKGFSPDYANPTFLQYHREAIRALGNRYGADGFFAFVELGSLGHWGEWHVAYNAGIRNLPPRAIREQYVEQYREAFPNTPLLMRRPFSIARQLELGLYNDLTGDDQGTHEWLSWIANGGNYDQTDEVGELVPMPSAWQTSPIGGEQTGAISSEALYGADLWQTIQLLEQSHTTFVGPNSPADIAPGGDLQAGIDHVLSRIGYRLYIPQVTAPRWVLLSNHLDLQLVFRNEGVAPFYFDWPAQLYLIDPQGEIRASHAAAVDLRRFLPDQSYAVSLSIPLKGLQAGSYQIGFAILDPLTQQPAIRLAMDSTRADLIQILGTVAIIGSPR